MSASFRRSAVFARSFRSRLPIGKNHASTGSPAFLIYHIAVFNLSSNRQPDVRWLVCEYWGDPALGSNLSLREIQNVLGKSMTPAAGRDRQPA